MSMSNSVALLDLEQHTPTAASLSALLEQHAMLYLFHCQGQFHYALTDLTEFATWISTGQVVILESALASIKEFEYALLVGQLLALVEVDTQIEVISAMPSSQLLIQLMQDADLQCHLTQIAADELVIKPELAATATTLPMLHPFMRMLQQQPQLQQWRQQLLGALEKQPFSRLSSLSNWAQRQLQPRVAAVQHPKLEQIVAKESIKSTPDTPPPAAPDSLASVQSQLNQNFHQIDFLQVEVLRKLHQLQVDKPKDIYELRDLLEQIFPESDVGMVLKELLEKGYIYWNGHEVIYSHEMYLN